MPAPCVLPWAGRCSICQTSRRCGAGTSSPFLLALALPASGSAGGPGVWAAITPAALSNIDQVGLVRNASGLHVVWRAKHGTKVDLLERTISAGGPAGGTSKVAAVWGSLTNAGVVVSGSGLQAFWGGLRTTSTSDPYSSGTVFSANAAAAGTSWTLAPGPAAAPSSAYASDVIGAAVQKDGTPVTSWTGTGGFYVHRGLDPAAPNVKVQAACCAYEATLATDSASGEVYAAWYSNATGGYGIHVRRVLPSLGPDRIMPGSGSADRKSAVSPIQAVGITGRVGGGVCAAYGVGYPTWKTVDVWCSRRGTPVRVWMGDVRHFTVAPAKDGRIWAIWATGDTIYAARSNRAVTAFGAPVAVAPPGGTTDIWNVSGDGGASPTAPLDLLASVSKSGIGVWHTQVMPGLSVTARPATQSIVIAVLDAGDLVSGAHLQIAGPHGETLAAPAGHVVARGLPAGRYTVTATATGYTAAKATFVVH